MNLYEYPSHQMDDIYNCNHLEIIESSSGVVIQSRIILKSNHLQFIYREAVFKPKFAGGKGKSE